jgi:hypothetical protein
VLALFDAGVRGRVVALPDGLCADAAKTRLGGHSPWPAGSETRIPSTLTYATPSPTIAHVGYHGNELDALPGGGGSLRAAPAGPGDAGGSVTGPRHYTGAGVRGG